MSGARPSADAVAAAEVELEKVREDWLRRPGVTGIDVGLRRRGVTLTDEVAIRVFVDPGLAAAEPREALRLPEQVGGVPVDVIRKSFALE